VLQGLKLHDIEERRIDTDDPRRAGAGHAPAMSRAGAGHAPAMITAAATHIEDTPAGQRRNVLPQALPLPVGAPLGIDVETEQFERPLAPGMQFPQGGVHGAALLRADIGGQTDAHRITVQLDA